MKDYMEYLSDTEMEDLIQDIEQTDMVYAPADMQDQILEMLDREALVSGKPDERSQQEKIIAFKRYRFRVLTTVAVAVLVVFLLPKMEDLQQQSTDLRKPVQKQEYVKQERYIFETLLGGVTIFANDSRFNLFRD